MAEPRTRSRIAPIAFGVSLALSAAVVGTAMFGAHGIERHEKLRSELDNVRTLNEQLKTENAKLRGQAKALRSDPEYIESVIRDELGYVKKDEMIFIFPSTRSAPATGEKAAKPAGEPALEQPAPEKADQPAQPAPEDEE